MKPNEERNKELVQKRLGDPKKWSYGELGKFYGLNKKTAEEIFKRDMKKYRLKKVSPKTKREASAKNGSIVRVS